MSQKDNPNKVEKSRETKDTARQVDHQELVQRLRPTKEEMKQKLLRIPKEPWIPPDRAHNGISYVLSVETDAEQQNKLAALVGLSDLLDFSKLSTQLSVVQAQSYRRIESLNEGLFGSNFVYINSPKGDLLYLDPKHKVYLQLEPDQIPQIKITDNFTDIDIDFADKGMELLQGRQTNKVVITAQHPTQLRWVLWLAQDKELQPFLDDIFDTLLGSGKKCKVMAKVLERIRDVGVPLLGELFIANPKGTFFSKPVLRFGLNKIEIKKFDPTEFSIPDNYLNLRKSKDVKARMERKRIRVTEPFRLSDVRSKKNVRPFGIKARQSLVRGSRTLLTDSLSSTYPDAEIGSPDCLGGSTYKSQVLIRIEQVLLNELKFIINSIFNRLQGFSGKNGHIDVNWLEQFRNYSESQPGGDGLYCLLRDENDSDGGKGLLDILARQQAERALFKGTILEDLVLQGNLMRLYENISRIIATISPEDRWARLGRADQILVGETWLQQQLATLSFTYPDPWGPETVFHDLLEVTLWDIKFDIQPGTEIINQQNGLVIRDGQIKLPLNISSVSGSMKLKTCPTTLYLAAAASSILLLGATAAWVAAVGAFLMLDIGEIFMELQDPVVDSTIQFTETGNHVIEPVVNVIVDATIHSYYRTYHEDIPHQIASIIKGLLIDWNDVFLHYEIENQLKEKLEKKLKSELVFPPPFDPASVSAVISSVEAVDGDHLSFWSDVLPDGLFSWSSLISPYTTQTGQIEHGFWDQERALKVWSELEGTPLLLGGFAISQNLLNHLLYMLWSRGDFSYIMSPDFNTKITEKLQSICGEQFSRPYSQIWLAVPPRIIFTPRISVDKGLYATAFFDDVRLCLHTSESKEKWGTAEFKFAAQTGAQIGFGAVAKTGDELDLTRVSGRFVDVYFDLDRIGVQIIHPEVKDVVGIGPSLSSIQVNMTDTLDDIYIDAMRSMLVSHTDKVVPSPINDDYTVQGYKLAGQKIIVKLFPYRGIIYGQLGVLGAIQAILGNNPLVEINEPEFSCASGEAIRELAGNREIIR